MNIAKIALTLCILLLLVTILTIYVVIEEIKRYRLLSRKVRTIESTFHQLIDICRELTLRTEMDKEELIRMENLYSTQNMKQKSSDRNMRDLIRRVNAMAGFPEVNE